MKDASGNELPRSYENSLQCRCYMLSDKVDKAMWMLAHACVNSGHRTKAEMVEAMNEAQKLLIEVKQELVGGG